MNILFNLFSYMTLFSVIWKNETIEEHHPLIEELIATDIFQRLKQIDQSGPTKYFGHIESFERYGNQGVLPAFNRFDHSMGVFWLVKYKGKGSLEEQTAALLHDVSHTAFSHLGDYLFAKLKKIASTDATQECYQDQVHLDFIKYNKLDTIVAKYNIDINDLEPFKHKILKAPKGELSADRIQYIVHTGVVFNIITVAQAGEIIDDITYEDGTWFFGKNVNAKIFADLSIILTKDLYTSPQNYVIYQYFTKAILRAIELNLFSLDDFQYGTDGFILTKLQQTQDKLIEHIINRLDNINSIFVVVNFEQGEMKVNNFTLRAIDPKIKMLDGGYTKLSENNIEFKNSFENLKLFCKEGYGIEFIEEEQTILAKLEEQINTEVEIIGQNII